MTCQGAATGAATGAVRVGVKTVVRTEKRAVVVFMLISLVRFDFRFMRFDDCWR